MRSADSTAVRTDGSRHNQIVVLEKLFHHLIQAHSQMRILYSLIRLLFGPCKGLTIEMTGGGRIVGLDFVERSPLNALGSALVERSVLVYEYGLIDELLAHTIPHGPSLIVGSSILDPSAHDDPLVCRHLLHGCLKMVYSDIEKYLWTLLSVALLVGIRPNKVLLLNMMIVADHI